MFEDKPLGSLHQRTNNILASSTFPWLSELAQYWSKVRNIPKKRQFLL